LTVTSAAWAYRVAEQKLRRSVMQSSRRIIGGFLGGMLECSVLAVNYK
jgi:hypothetical protein